MEWRLKSGDLTFLIHPPPDTPLNQRKKQHSPADATSSAMRVCGMSNPSRQPEALVVEHTAGDRTLSSEWSYLLLISM